MLLLVTALATARALTVIARDEPLAGSLFLAGCLLVWLGRSPWFLAAGATACSALMTHQTGSVVLFAWVAAAFACLTGPALVTAIRSQVIVVYTFAVAHKVFSDFLTGSIIGYQLPWLPRPDLAAAGVVLAEALLAYAVCKRWGWALPLAIVCHASFVAGMSQNPVHAVALSAFNVHICLLIWWVGQGAATTSNTAAPESAAVPPQRVCAVPLPDERACPSLYV